MFVLDETFIIFDNISKKREKFLKDHGIKTWNDLLNKGESILNPKEYRKLKHEIKKAEKKLIHKDIEYFINRLDEKDYYLLYENFKDMACFLDIETTGIDDYSDLTILGISDSKEHYRVFINDLNLDINQIMKYLRNFKIVITFYGSRFDLPFLLKRYPELEKIFKKMAHIDLCFLGHRVGFKGGLKKIEKQIGIEREENIQGLTGYDAINLWKNYRNGDKKSLITLIKYNRSDVLNLIKLIEIEIKMLKDFDSNENVFLNASLR